MTAELLFSVAHNWSCTKGRACELQKGAAAAAIWRVNSPVCWCSCTGWVEAGLIVFLLM